MKVNMTPNPLDVVTIHASQGDTEARQWEFELHNNGELIDTSDVKEQLVFKAYKGGTEQLLPENGSVPITAPFLGDIKYPQGLLTDQEFTYRQSPTEEDGLAKITDIKGNTLVWNQLVQNGNFADTSGWSVVRGTLSASNNILSYTVTELGGGGLQNRILRSVPIPAGHKVFVSISIKATKPFVFLADVNGEFYLKNPIIANEWNLCQAIRTVSTGMENFVFGCPSTFGDMAVGDVIQFKEVILIDLTQMFGAGNEPATIEEFTSLFSLPYYGYNAGTLLSFNGNGIKTTGKNKLKTPTSATLNGITFNVGADGQIQITGTATAQTDFYLYGASGRYDDMGIMSSTYTFSCRKDSTTTGLNFFLVGQQTGTKIGVELNNTFLSQTVALDGSDKYRVFMRVNNGTTINTKVALQLEFGSTATAYEPYTSSTLSLPISTYFPNGMDGVGTDYDELTESKAHHRMTRVDLGSLTWVYDSAYTRFYTDGLGGSIKFVEHNEIANVLTNDYLAYSNDTAWRGNIDKSMWVSSRRLYMVNTSYSDATTFKNAMSGVYLVYPLATPTETPITTATLVTENAEIPLSNEDGVLIGKCTEQLSENPGFIDAKIKLTDSDGECYSNKLQLHIERSPQ